MSKIQRDVVLNSITNLKGISSNKFWGLIALFSCTNDELEDLVTYTISTDELSSRLQDLFYFGENEINYDSKRKIFFQLSNQWGNSITDLVKNGRVSILDAAIFFFKNIEFNSPILAKDLVSRFTQTLNIPQTVLNRIFERDYNENERILTEQNYSSSLVYEYFKTKMNINNDNDTLSFEKPYTISSHPGELKRAPFIQTLYSGSSIQELILLTDFNIDEFYPRERTVNSTLNSGNRIERLNTIYYGPPGTGKTRKVQLNHLTNKDSNNSKFITFHQSFSYEEFIEGLKPVIIHSKEQVYENSNLRRFIKHTFTILQEQLNLTLLNLKVEEVNSTINDNSYKGLRINRFFGSSNLFGKFAAKQTDKALSSSGTLRYFDEPFIVINGEYIYLTTQWGDVDGNGLTFQNFKRFVSDISNSLYAVEKKDGHFTLKHQSDENTNVIYKNVRGVFYDACESAARLAGYESLQACIEDSKEGRAEKMKMATESNRNFVMCIDEINRANISSVFGDLITHVEENKRLGGSEELSVILPYSKAKFGVPSNLQIVGTMNTADRSTTLLDSALRRRFYFEEVLPQANVLSQINFDGINMSQLLTVMNKRIIYFLGKDQTIGHSYFIGLKNSFNPKKELLSIFLVNIIPLLEEYFYNDIPKIRLILGEGTKNSELCFYKVDDDADQLFDSVEDDFDNDVTSFTKNLELVKLAESSSESNISSDIFTKIYK